MGIEKFFRIRTFLTAAAVSAALGCGNSVAGSCAETGHGDPDGGSSTQSSSCADPGGCTYDLSTVEPCTCRYLCMEAYNCGALAAPYPHSTGPFLDCFTDCEAKRKRDGDAVLAIMDCVNKECSSDAMEKCGW